ncbi:hypothetical protein ACOMHN_052463 [Nucella lapillus]
MRQASKDLVVSPACSRTRRPDRPLYTPPQRNAVAPPHTHRRRSAAPPSAPQRGETPPSAPQRGETPPSAPQKSSTTEESSTDQFSDIDQWGAMSPTPGSLAPPTAVSQTSTPTGQGSGDPHPLPLDRVVPRRPATGRGRAKPEQEDQASTMEEFSATDQFRDIDQLGAMSPTSGSLAPVTQTSTPTTITQTSTPTTQTSTPTGRVPANTPRAGQSSTDPHPLARDWQRQSYARTRGPGQY